MTVTATATFNEIMQLPFIISFVYEITVFFFPFKMFMHD